eukprot:2489803-Amphidinium_carterae.1
MAYASLHDALDRTNRWEYSTCTSGFVALLVHRPTLDWQEVEGPPPLSGQLLDAEKWQQVAAFLYDKAC